MEAPNLLTKMRLSRGMTRAGLGDQAGINERTLMRFENENRRPKPTTAIRILKALEKNSPLDEDETISALNYFQLSGGVFERIRTEVHQEQLAKMGNIKATTQGHMGALRTFERLLAMVGPDRLSGMLDALLVAEQTRQANPATIKFSAEPFYASDGKMYKMEEHIPSKIVKKKAQRKSS